MRTQVTASALSLFVLFLLALWAPAASANPGFDDGGGAGLPACAVCHGDLADRGPDHDTHSELANDDCGLCHGSGSRNDPALDNCVRCHGRDQDAGGDALSAGLGRGLRQHHVTVGAAACGNCHSDATGPAGVGEHVLPAFYPQALGGAGLDSCDGSEENFPSNSVSLDNDGDGLTDSADPDCAGNAAPTADPNGPYNADVGVSITFDGSGSSDDGTIVEYAWDFGDGTAMGMGVNPVHTYGAAGTYTVTLTVTDDGGLTDSAVTTATITEAPPPNQAPTANANGPYNAQVGDVINFSAAGSSDPDGTIVTYDWDFGDGSSGVGANPTHSYAAAGTYTVTLTVTDDGGLTDSAVTTADIADQPMLPRADPNGPYSGFVNEVVAFDGSGSVDPDGGAIQSWDWDFGDGNSGTGETPTHIYVAEGSYVVQLTVTDDEGQVSVAATTTAVIEIRPANQAPIANANGPYSEIVGATITFDSAGSSDAEDPNTALTFAWDFGDGNTGTGQSPTHSYAVAGTYTVTLTVTDSGGLSDVSVTSAVIENRPTDEDGETLYNAWCLGCHGDFDQPNQASSIKVLGARSCSINAAIDGNPSASAITPYPDGVPDMQFMQGMLSGANVDAISDWLNASLVSAMERYTSTCSGCHGADGSGGFVGTDIRGKGNNLQQAILEEDSMQFLSCLPDWEVTALGDFLGRPVVTGSRGGGSGATGPTFLLVLGWVAILMRRFSATTRVNQTTADTDW